MSSVIGFASRLSDLKIQTKLLGAFAFVALLLALSGVAGIFFANRINDTVEVVSRVASPVMNDVIALRDGAGDFRQALAEMTASDRAAASARVRPDDFDEIARQRIDSLRGLSDTNSLSLPINELANGEKAFAATARQMVGLHREMVAAIGSADALAVKFETLRAELEARLGELSGRSETTMNEGEDKAKTAVQSGTAQIKDIEKILSDTFNTNYPVVQGSYKLAGYLAQFSYLVTAHRTAPDAEALTAVENKFKSTLSAAKSRLRRFAGRVVDDASKADVERITQGLNETETLVVKEGGLFAASREAQRARSETASRAKELDAAAAAYAATLDRVATDARELSAKADRNAASSVADAEISLAVLVVIGTILALGFGYLAARSVARPITQITASMRRLADGDTTVEIPGAGRGDEVGAIAGAVQVFKDSMIETERLRAEQKEMEKQAEARKKTDMNKLADEFEATVSGVVRGVSTTSSTLQSTAQSMSSTAERTTRESTAMAAASEQASTNVQTVASAAEELSSSIAEIGRQVAESTTITQQAVSEATRTNEQIRGLEEAAQKIGDVVKLIGDIAGQTNLLALNATIEAARAGEAGKGFAVVASEVKNLATQTAKATEEITAKIAEIQTVSSKSVAAIGGIAQTIGRINEIATTIASAVEEQGAATQEIARNVQQAAAGTNEVSSNIASVTAAADETGKSAGQVLDASGELTKQSQQLHSQVDAFIQRIRAA